MVTCNNIFRIMSAPPALPARAKPKLRSADGSALDPIAVDGAELREQAAASMSLAIELALTLGYTGDKG